MKPSTCEQVAEIALAEAEGKVLAAIDLAFRDQHLRACNHCQTENRALELLRLSPNEASHFAFDGASSEKIISGALSQLRACSKESDFLADFVVSAESPRETDCLATDDAEPPITAFWRKPTAWAAGMAAAAAIFLMVRASTDFSTDFSPEFSKVDENGAPDLSSVLKANVLKASSSSGLSYGVPIGEGQLLHAEEEIALSLGPDIVVLLEPGSRAKLAKLNHTTAEISLEFGRIHASVRPHSTFFEKGFAVSTSQGMVEVTGTLFSVEAKKGTAGSWVGVLRGSVKVTSSADSANLRHGRVRALEAQQIGSLQTRKMTSQEQQMVRGAMERISLIEQGSIAAVSPGKAATNAAKQEENRSAAVTRPKTGVSKLAHAGSAKELLRKAQELRRLRNWKASAQAYSELIAAYPGEEIAKNAKVSYGYLLLEQLNNYSGGLKFCQEYLFQHPEGVLAAEAAICRIKALRALGSAEEEQIAIEQFLELFPNSYHASAFRKRVQQIRSR